MDPEQELEEKEPFIPHQVSKHRLKHFIFEPKIVITAQWVIIILLVMVFAIRDYSQSNGNLCLPRSRVYSPAEDAIAYKNYNFIGSAKNQTTEYRGPLSTANNEKWEELSRYAISKIPKDQARLLTNKTVPIANEPGYYVVALDVFHQLHCLNAIRKRIWTTGITLAEEDEEEITHIDHCVDSIRQYIMCNTDISPIVWRWDYNNSIARPIDRIYHTCRDFEAIHEWAKVHQLGTFDRTTYVEDDLV